MPCPPSIDHGGKDISRNHLRYYFVGPFRSSRKTSVVLVQILFLGVFSWGLENGVGGGLSTSLRTLFRTLPIHIVPDLDHDVEA